MGKEDGGMGTAVSVYDMRGQGDDVGWAFLGGRSKVRERGRRTVPLKFLGSALGFSRSCCVLP